MISWACLGVAACVLALARQVEDAEGYAQGEQRGDRGRDDPLPPLGLVLQDRDLALQPGAAVRPVDRPVQVAEAPVGEVDVVLEPVAVAGQALVDAGDQLVRLPL